MFSQSLIIFFFIIVNKGSSSAGYFLYKHILITISDAKKKKTGTEFVFFKRLTYHMVTLGYLSFCYRNVMLWKNLAVKKISILFWNHEGNWEIFCILIFWKIYLKFYLPTTDFYTKCFSYILTVILLEPYRDYPLPPV